MSDFRRLVEHIHAIDDALAGQVDREGLEQLRRDLVRQARRPARYVLAPVGPDEWLIGPEDAPVRLRCTLLGLRVAHQALAGLRPAVADLCPGKAQAATVVRTAIHTTAANWLEHTAKCPDLAELLRSHHGLRVERGHVTYTRPAGAPEVITLYETHTKHFAAPRGPAMLTADQDEGPTMQVRAIEMGFYGGTRVRPGTVFEMPEATRDKLPAWVEPADGPASPVKPPPLMGDIRPLGAQRVSAAKTGAPGQFRAV